MKPQFNQSEKHSENSGVVCQDFFHLVRIPTFSLRNTDNASVSKFVGRFAYLERRRN